ncbi:transcriptional regulator, ArsR family [Renibacterium salmoninarum ATCC 33209]|uniref:Transcriptional regulator, ArsR family n=1 Tax=Renibacterium salmoninarum (strain ATCC 33209 / DSM 20767 / JCM 11484 / NBRC 15589 / NCIMB 2235) TaxID=288705 RepID=A9WT10_RENSM|nr:metalloregulator ArsR/SmtB family transcription factor [Renibacterium salmoninarum]ABY23948.1 transcriptional regulator, ArsR family [Renibacterium salmoninarum ATCC 33209]
MATDQLSTVFQALADPTRRAILARLSDGDANVSELAEPFEISLPAISRHLKVLEAAGLISRGQTAQWRSAKLEPIALEEAFEWMAPYRQIWDTRLGRLEKHLKTVQEMQEEK